MKMGSFVFFVLNFLSLLLSPNLTFAGNGAGVVDKVEEGTLSKVITPPKDGEVCFSPEEPCDLKLIKFIEMAQKSVDIAIYDINLDQLVHQLLLASKKLQVRIIVDTRQAKGLHSLVPLLIKAGANVRSGRQRGIMHNKFAIVDGRMIETGSFNFTNHASKANNENQIYIANPEIVKRYRDRFEEIWQMAGPTQPVEISKRESK